MQFFVHAGLSPISGLTSHVQWHIEKNFWFKVKNKIILLWNVSNFFKLCTVHSKVSKTDIKRSIFVGHLLLTCFSAMLQWYPQCTMLYYSASVLPALFGFHPVLALGCIAGWLRFRSMARTWRISGMKMRDFLWCSPTPHLSQKKLWDFDAVPEWAKKLFKIKKVLL